MLANVSCHVLIGCFSCEFLEYFMKIVAAAESALFGNGLESPVGVLGHEFFGMFHSQPLYPIGIRFIAGSVEPGAE